MRRAQRQDSGAGGDNKERKEVEGIEYHTMW